MNVEQDGFFEIGGYFKDDGLEFDGLLVYEFDTGILNALR